VKFPVANTEGGLFGQAPCLLDFRAGVKMTYVAARIER
jgi:hypothetical protein